MPIQFGISASPKQSSFTALIAKRFSNDSEKLFATNLASEDCRVTRYHQSATITSLNLGEPHERSSQ
jgi:hypothetical protein